MIDTVIFDKVALIGLGLIGSSLARVLRREDLAKTIAGCAQSDATRRAAISLGLVDTVHADPADCVVYADLVVLCTPLSAYLPVIKAAAINLKPGAIVSDVGSVKESVLRDLSPLLPAGVHLVPGHPVAGTEQSGPEAGFAELFEGRWCILTPARDVDPLALERVHDMWACAGSKVEVMDAAHHDKVLAITSHLPHLIAYTIVGTASALEGQLRADEALVETAEVVKFSAGGFRDFTRIAASDPTMWRDVFMHNQEAVLEMLGRFTEDLTALQRAIRWGDAEALEAWFTRTRAIRRGIVEAGQAGTFRATEPSESRESASQAAGRKTAADP